MGGPNTVAMAEGLVLRGLGLRMLVNGGVVTRLDKDLLFHEGEADGIDNDTWAAAIEKLLESGRIIEYKISDLPETLPLSSCSQSGYTTRDHLLDLLRTAKARQVEELRDFLEYSGVPIPAVRTSVTSGQKQRIDNAVRKLNEVLAEVTVRNPDNRVVWYLDASGDLNLMVEPENQMDPDQQYIAHSAHLKAAGAGDW